MSFAALIAIGLVALLFLGGLLVTLLLLAHPKSRPYGLALLGVGVVIVGGLAFLLWNTTRLHSEGLTPEALTVGEAADGPAPRPLQADVPADRAADGGHTTAGEASGTTAAAPPSTSPRQPGRVIKALTAALARGIQETKEDRKEPGATPGAGEASGVASAASEPAEPPPGWIDIHPSRKWVITEQRLVGDVYQMSAVVGPCATRAECDERLPELRKAALAEYAEKLRPAGAGGVRFPTEAFEDRVVCKDPRELTNHYEKAGRLKQLHVLLEFEPDLVQDIKDQWIQGMVAQRLWYTGTGLTALLALLAVAYGGLLADRATEGRRRGRLGFAAVAAAALIVVVAAAVIGTAG